MSDTIRHRAPGVWERTVGAWGTVGHLLAPAARRRDKIIAARAAADHRGDLDTVERFVTFVGFPRSGHTVVGAMLNAHRNVVIGHRMQVYDYVRAGFSAEELLAMSLVADERFAHKGRVGSKRYVYDVPTPWQGSYERLLVAGDGNASAKTLERHPELFAQLRDRIGVPLRTITITRDPFDNVTTLATRNNLTLDEATDRYGRWCETVTALRSTVPENEWVVMSHEDVVGDPRRYITELCGFLGVPVDETHLDACAAASYARPRRSRDTVEWPRQSATRLQAVVAAHAFLAPYAAD